VLENFSYSSQIQLTVSISVFILAFVVPLFLTRSAIRLTGHAFARNVHRSQSKYPLNGNGAPSATEQSVSSGHAFDLQARTL
jgi:hypothetical protein